jgi:sugar phosphate permease
MLVAVHKRPHPRWYPRKQRGILLSVYRTSTSLGHARRRLGMTVPYHVA